MFVDEWSPNPLVHTNFNMFVYELKIVNGIPEKYSPCKVKMVYNITSKPSGLWQSCH